MAWFVAVLTAVQTLVVVLQFFGVGAGRVATRPRSPLGAMVLVLMLTWVGAACDVHFRKTPPVSITQVAVTPVEKFDFTYANVRFFGDSDHCPTADRWNIYSCFAIHDADADTYRVILFFDHPLAYGKFRLDLSKTPLDRLPPGQPLDNSYYSVSELNDNHVAEIVIDKDVAKQTATAKRWIRIQPLPWTHWGQY